MGKDAGMYASTILFGPMFMPLSDKMAWKTLGESN